MKKKITQVQIAIQKILRYGYAVQDGDTGNDFNQQEQSNGDEVLMMMITTVNIFLILKVIVGKICLQYNDQIQCEPPCDNPCQFQITGQYSVALPDGRIQTVTYSVRPETGYVVSAKNSTLRTPQKFSSG